MCVPPRVILHWFDSYELQEMAAYEKVAGPFDSSWSMEIQAQLHELVQQHLIVTVDANSEKPSKMKVTPVPRPYLVPEDQAKEKKNDISGLLAELDLRDKQPPQEGGYGASYL